MYNVVNVLFKISPLILFVYHLWTRSAWSTSRLVCGDHTHVPNSRSGCTNVVYALTRMRGSLEAKDFRIKDARLLPACTVLEMCFLKSRWSSMVIPRSRTKWDHGNKFDSRVPYKCGADRGPGPYFFSPSLPAIKRCPCIGAVSYTHLTLPTIYSV